MVAEGSQNSIKVGDQPTKTEIPGTVCPDMTRLHSIGAVSQSFFLGNLSDLS